eukprot:6220489-Pyramimonas_sp.AAC.1
MWPAGDVCPRRPRHRRVPHGQGGLSGTPWPCIAMWVIGPWRCRPLVPALLAVLAASIPASQACSLRNSRFSSSLSSWPWAGPAGAIAFGP